ncbi:MAG TPA: hypothetical protein VNG53_07510 [Bacteroidia bacterium]|nr:hypothetical protein [Bacteroidia bacterium]
MQYLKINLNKGFYRLDETKEIWIELDQLSKDHLLILLKFATEKDFEMDKYNNDLLQNPAHNIIYKNIYGKFNDFLDNKTRFQDSVELIYKSALDKYKILSED